MKGKSRLLPPIHPGEVLKEELMVPFGISINKLARELRVPPGRIGDIVNRKRGVSADTALRLARYFGTTPAFWMNLQSAYDIEVAERESQAEIARDVRPRRAA